LTSKYIRPSPGIPFRKRLFDLAFTTPGLILISPLLALIGILAWILQGRPILFRQVRPGYRAEPFTLYKFGTMTEALDPQGIPRSDAERLSPFGRFLRSLSLDELPELFNVLKGEMSLVGPRPEDPRYVALYTPEQRGLLAVAPGMTSPASLLYYEEDSLLSGEDWETHYLQRVLPDKLRIELDYLRQRTFGADLRILWRTAMALLGRGASSPGVRLKSRPIERSSPR